MKLLFAALLGSVLSVQPLLAQDLEKQVSAVVAANKHVTLAAQRSGQLSDTLVNQGTFVQQGQVLARFECPYEEALVEAASIELKQANTNLTLQRRLVARGAAGRADVVQANQRVELQNAQLKLENAKALACSVKAPFSGVIIDWKAKPFSTVSQGEPLVEIADLNDLYIELILPVVWLADLENANALTFTPENQDGSYAVKIDFISPMIDGVSQTIRVTALLQTDNTAPRIGTSGLVSLR